jgi:hypothetical protein
MLVRLAFGSRVGEVVDFLPHEALAMLADGRATRPDADVVAVDVPVQTAHVAAREDRNIPRHKRRAVR